MEIDFGRRYAGGIAAAICVATLGLAGCSDEPEAQPQAEVSVAAASDAIVDGARTLLAYVPADSPYAFALLEPLPDAVVEKFEASLDGQMSSYQSMLRSAMEEADFTAENGGPLLEATLQELTDRMSVEGLKSIGWDLKSLNALYGVGLLPVARFTLNDTSAFESFVEAIEARAEEQFDRGETAGLGYRYVEFDGARVAFGTAPGHLFMALYPAELSDDALASVIGATPPSVNMLADNEIVRLNAEHDWRPHGSGYVDVVAVVDRILNPGSDAVAAELRSMLDSGPDELTDVCANELREMAGIMPKIVSGMRQYDAERLVNETIFRLRNDLATGLSNLSSPVPGMSERDAGMMSFGISFKLLALKQFVATQVEALQSDPYECEWFAELNEVEQVASQLEQPVPPFVSLFKGFRFVLDELSFEEGQSQPDFSGRALIAMDNPQMLLGMAQMMSPELAALQIEPNGEPVALPADALPAGSPQPYLAMNDAGIAIGVGPDNGAQLGALLGAPAPEDDMPVMAFTYDMQAFGDLMTRFGDMMPADSDEDQAAMEDMRGVFQNQMFDRVSTLVYLTDRGVEMTYEADLK